MAKNEVLINAPAPVVGGPVEITKGRFLASLIRNNSKIRKDRAQAIGEDCYLIYRRTIEDIQMAITRMQRERENMLDLSPDNALSLIVASDFDGVAFVQKDLELGVKIRNERIRLRIAIDRFNELFAEEGAPVAVDAKTEEVE
jgi:hypothetical protein